MKIEDKINYVVNYIGGRGPDTWHANIEVGASNIQEALILATSELKENGGHIVSIEQID